MKYLYSILAGIILAFAYPNFAGHGFAPLAILAYVILYRSLFFSKKLSHHFLLIFFFCLSFSLMGFYWMSTTLSVFGQIPYYQAILASTLFSLIVLPQLWFQAIFAFYCQKKQLSKLNVILILSISHVIFEAYIPSQFPVWLGHSWLSFGYHLPLASYLGASFYSYALILIILPLSLLPFNKSLLVITLAGIILIFLDFALIPFTKPLTALKDPSSNSLTVRLVQANVGNFLKVDAELGSVDSAQEVYERYQNLSLSPVNEKIDLIIWPETAIPSLLDSQNWQKIKELDPDLDRILTDLPTDTSLLFGGYDKGLVELSTNHIFTEYNSAFFHSNQLLQVYHKHKLIPFGETLPFSSITSKYIDYFPGVSLFSRGASLSAINLPKNSVAITPICYELLDTSFIRTFLLANPKIDLMVNLTNDSWYGNTAEPHQHLFLATWRALEFRRPIIRSTNTGISLIIDVDGKFSNQLNVDDEKVLDQKIYLHPRSRTFYEQWGMLAIISLMLILNGLLYLLATKPSFIKS